MSRARRAVAQRFASLHSDQRGVVAVIVAGCMVAFLGMGAMAIDVAGWYQTRSHAQDTADAAALAAANYMASGSGNTCGNATSGAISVAIGYAAKNGLTISTPNVICPYGAGDRVQVTVPTTAPTYFAQLLGVSNPNVSATAVASWTLTTGVADGLFAFNSACSPGSAGISISVNNVDITGAIHSNGSFFDNANNSTLGPTTYVGASSCSSVSANHATFTSGPSNAAVQSYPTDYSKNLSTLCPTFVTGSASYTANTLTVPPGIYCYTGSITINVNNLTATGVTLIANTVNISANNATISPATGAGNLAIYQTAGGWNAASGTCTSTTSSITSNTNNETISGDVFAPCSTINVNTNNDTSNFFEGYNVNISSNNVSFTGDGPLSGGTSAGDSLTG